MCGILGILPAAHPEKFNSALNRLAHRGPDDAGIWSDQYKKIMLGHRRLAILDLSQKGRQPMEWQDRYVITFNGEIYNYIELRNELRKKGVSFRTDTDTEVLLALFAEYGVSFLSKLNGMWAFGIYDKQEDSLFLSRDRMGEKPLYYLETQETFAFASEMKALYPFLAQLDPDYELIEKARNNVFCYEATDQCLIKGIRRFPAAAYAIYKKEQLTIHSYWKSLDNRITVPERYEAQVEMFRELFIDSCKLRMRSDVPIGTALSGGIDSSATISTMAHIAKTQVGTFKTDWQHAFVASFPGSEWDETEEARKVADNINVPVTFLPIDPIKGIESIFYYSYLFEDLYLTSPIPFIQLYGKIRSSGTKVTLDGHGSDELFGGYRHDIISKLKDDYPNPFRIRKTLETVANVAQEPASISMGRVYLEWRRISRNRSVRHEKAIKTFQAADMDYFNRQLYQSTFETVLPTLLRNYDRYSMINGVEVRMPFLDHRIVSLAFSIPGSSKVRNGFSKAIVRDAMKGLIPDEIRTLKRKIGFNSPFTEWLKGPLKEWCLDLLRSSEFQSATIIDPQTVSAKINYVIENPAATMMDGGDAWTTLMPYIWERSLMFAGGKKFTD